MKRLVANAETGEIVEVDLTAEEIAELEASAPPIVLPEPVTIVFNVDLWSRMTDDEADQVGAAMDQQPFRVRKIFESASSFRSDHELWPLLEQIATTLFGAERAAQILAPSA
ncbi:hypothetical protein FB593_102518 [Rhizobium sp. SJZ105]|uniref:hypothetical protein n=1 Tax=Rhizobium sp. SJZ105 TaxID=2572678 RepID=UPI0011AC0019|nr:hypothetical protein [Rhizobium sp. SJZ105]TWC85666.1 hypothetical protein FB593_102518 [Rhizobium sp. SJZ105]